MSRNQSKPLLRIPVRFVDGIWECAYGGSVPVDPMTTGHLVVERDAISDPAFLDMMLRKSKFLILGEGIELLVLLSIKETEDILESLRKYLIPFSDIKYDVPKRFMNIWGQAGLHVISVRIASPNDTQERKLDTNSGGLWLLTEGVEAKGLVSTQILLPEGVSQEPVVSLNHAFTKLSEVYEPWRISHTGNIYTRILYREKNDKWYPLDVLRNKKLIEKDHEIAVEIWNAFKEKMGIDFLI